MSSSQTAAPGGRSPFFDFSNMKGDLFGGLTACSALEAAVERHTHWFHMQQHSERTFFQRLPELCTDRTRYYERLQELRR